MTDLEEFRRFHQDTGDFNAVDKADRFLAMPEQTRIRLRNRWAHEDRLKREEEAAQKS